MGRPSLPLSLSNLRISTLDEEQAANQNRHRTRTVYRPKNRARYNQNKTRDVQPRKIMYTHAQMINLWYSPAAHNCPTDIEAFAVEKYEVREKGDYIDSIISVFPVQRTERKPATGDIQLRPSERPQLPKEIQAVKTRNHKKVYGRPRDYYTHDGVKYRF